MSKPETESLLKPTVIENVPEIRIEDYNASPLGTAPPNIDKEKEETAPLAESEEDLEDLSKPPLIDVNDGLTFDNRSGDEIDLSDRAGTFPYAPGFGPHINGTSPSPESIPDVNIYQHKKTVAQGMMDLALFSANANQLRYVVESRDHPYFYPGVVLISFSLLFQVAVGVGLLWNSRYDIKNDKEMHVANKINNFTVVGIFLVTVINVFISAFGTTAGTAAT